MRLSLPQQDVYFEQMLFTKVPIYNIGAKIEIKGACNINVLKEAYNELIMQHDSFRSVIHKDNKNISFQVAQTNIEDLDVVDFSYFENPLEKANSFMQSEFKKPFNLLNREPLYKFLLIKVHRQFHYLFSVYHHIITDGWGTSLMFQRLVQNYNEILSYGKVQSSYPFSYNDFIEDDLVYQNSTEFLIDRDYWLGKFKLLPKTFFEKIDTFNGIPKSNRKELVIKRNIYNQLNQVSGQVKCSTYHLLLGILFTYFGKKYQMDNLAIGVPVLNRGKSIFKKTVGLFMGVSPLKINLDFNLTFQELIVEIKNQLRQDYRHQRFPLGKLIQGLHLQNERERIFNITLSYEKQNYSVNFDKTKTKVTPLSHQSERVALALYVREFDENEDVKIDFDYSLKYFDDVSINQVVNHFENIMKCIIHKPDKKLGSIEYLDKKEKKQLLKKFNNTATKFSKKRTVIDLFNKQVSLFPKCIAIKDYQKEYTYFELDKISSQIAEYIISKYGEKEGFAVALLMERTSIMIVFLLALFKSRKPYIPLDPSFPVSRLNYIIDNSGAELVLTDSISSIIERKNVEVVNVQCILEESKKLDGNTSLKPSPEETAYIIYTSGSTGNPKGVEIGHRSLANFLISMKSIPGINSKDILYTVTTYSFDISILEFFAPLVSGASIYVPTQDVLRNPQLLLKKIEEVEPTIIQATPSFYKMLYSVGWKGNKNLKVLVGGDAMDEQLGERLINDNLEVWNMYGPTETTIWSSLKKMQHRKDIKNIGRPINNTQFYILDSSLNLLPIGTIGGIYIGGEGLAKGYYKNKELTRNKFIKNPFKKGSVIYETGDLGVRKSNGEILFLGRGDNQVKIRGYRIELGDIEANLLNYSENIDQVVVHPQVINEEKNLVAYYTSSVDIQKHILKDYLTSRLPTYMIPSFFMRLKKIPLTLNGKIDRKSLPLIEDEKLNNENYLSPTNDIENKLVELWERILGLNKVGIKDGFFELGGHSLVAIKLINLIAQEFSIFLNMNDIFAHPTIQSLAAYIGQQTLDKSNFIEFAEHKRYHKITSSQYNIWLACQQKNLSLAHNMFAAFECSGKLDLKKIEDAINCQINENEILRTNFIMLDDIVYQQIKPFEEINFKIVSEKTKEIEIHDSIKNTLSEEFDLQNDLLLRFKVLQVHENNWIFLFCIHHIIMDGISLEILIKNLILKYNENLELKSLKNIQFKDYSEWENKAVKEECLENKLFWNTYLANYVPKSSFIGDLNKINKYQGRRYYFEFSNKISFDIKKLATNQSTTPYVILLSAMNFLINKISGHLDTCIGILDSGRSHFQVENCLGLFIKTLVLRTKLIPDQKFSILIKTIESDLLEIERHKNVRYDIIPNSVINLLFVYQNPDFSFETIDGIRGVTIENIPINEVYSKFPMIFNIFEDGNCIKGYIEYNTSFYSNRLIKFISSMFSIVIQEIINGVKDLDKIELDKFETLTEAELDFDFNF